MKKMIDDKMNRDLKGTKELMAAVLIDSKRNLYKADQDLKKYAPGSKEHTNAERSFGFEKHWLEDGKNKEYVFSFPNICETMGLDPTKVRNRIYAGLETKMEE
jgi:hypothetical protein